MYDQVWQTFDLLNSDFIFKLKNGEYVVNMCMIVSRRGILLPSGVD